MKDDIKRLLNLSLPLSLSVSVSLSLSFSLSLDNFFSSASVIFNIFTFDEYKANNLEYCISGSIKALTR